MTTIQSIGQTSFRVDNQDYRIARIKKTYTYYYEFGDSLKILLIDSALEYYNKDKTRKLRIHTDVLRKETDKDITYFNKAGKELQNKRFSKGELMLLYRTKYDEKGRMIFHSLRRFPINDDGSVDAYFYKDSLTSDGRIEKCYSNSKSGIKHLSSIRCFNKKDLPLKEIYYDEKGDTLWTELYTYSSENKLLEHIHNEGDLKQIIYPEEKYLKPECEKEIIQDDLGLTAKNKLELIQSLLLTQKIGILSDDCEDLDYTFRSPDNRTRLVIVKRRIHHIREVWIVINQLIE